MKAHFFPRAFAGTLLMFLAMSVSHTFAAPRDAEWAKLKDAMEKDQPKTVIELARGIETAAAADQAWGEVAKAITLRLGLGGRIEGGPQAAIKAMDAEMATAPAAVQPILRAIQAHWFHSYYQRNRWRFAHRSATAEAPGADIETWDLKRILAEVDQRFQAALADQASLQKLPVATFGEIFTTGTLGDTFRPTVFDFLAHQALDFYASEEVVVSLPQDAFEIEAAGPALGAADAFLAWNPESSDTTSPRLRALRLFQDLMRFHRDDTDHTAFLHADLERLRWAGEAAVGPEKSARLDAALRGFIESHAGHPLSADARLDVATALSEAGKFRDAHAMAKAGADAFPEHPFGKLCRNLFLGLEEPSLGLALETAWTPAGSVIRVNHRNVSQVHFRAYARPWSINKDTLRDDPGPENIAAVRALLKGKPVVSWDVPLPDDRDFAPRVAHLAAPENLAPGYYWLVASGNEEFSPENNALACGQFHVTSLTMLVRHFPAQGVIEGIVADAVTGAPLEGIEVIEAQERNHLPGTRKESHRTGPDGVFRLASNREHGNLLFVATRGKDRAITRFWGGGSGRNLPDGPQDAIVLFTDRALYRPGQSIQFKGIWCRHDRDQADYATVAKATTTVRLVDMNGKEIESLILETNERGSFSGAFTAPSGSVLGQFTLHTPHGSAAVQVEEYKRPKFSSEIHPPAAPAALGQKVIVKAVATAYTGAPIDGAKVEWRVTRQPRWPQWIRWCWWFYPPPSEAAEIASGTGVTGTDGAFPIEFTAAPDKSIDPASEPIFDFLVTADITDGTGETRSADYPVSVAYTALTAALSAPDWLVAGENVVITARTTSHDGEPRPAEGILRVHKLKQPAACARPSPFDEDGSMDPFHPDDGDRESAPPTSANPDKWELGEVVKDTRLTMPADGDTKGTATATFQLPAGLYRVVFETKDANGRDVQAMLGLHVVAPEAATFTPPIPFFTGSPATTRQPGETFTLVWGSGYESARACVEWFKAGELLKREWSQPGRTQQTFTWPITGDLRGGLHARVTQLTQNTLEVAHIHIAVPWKNKDLQVRWEHFTSKLEPGAKETWTAIVTGPDGETAAAEMVATLYDASLDAFLPHRFPGFGGMFRNDPGIWTRDTFSNDTSSLQLFANWSSPDLFSLDGPAFRDFSPEVGIFQGFGGGGRMLRRSKNGGAFPQAMMAPGMPMEDAMLSAPAPAAAMDPFGGEGMAPTGNRSGDFAVTREDIDAVLNKADGAAGAAADVAQVAARKNLQETAFFFPHLTSDEAGAIRMSFTMPEALTKWRFLGFAHDPEMRSAFLEAETVTSKDLMVQPNPPRFLREGDALYFTVKITNRSDKAQSGTARFTLADAATLADATARLGVTAPDQPFEVPAGESRTLSWKLTVPDGAGFLQYKAVATSGALSDGEEGWLPVIPRRVLVTESMALPIRGAGEKKFTFEKLRDSGKSDSLQSQFLHVQAVSQPAWYAVMALPYLMEFPHECAEQTFNRYYANALARHIALSDPKIRAIFDQWKGTEALDSPLLKNQDLKGILIDETPWLREAKDESAARRRVGLLFDDNHMGDQLDRALDRLGALQHHDGLFPWFDGAPGNEYITLYIATGFARLRALGVETDITPALKALPALDRALRDRHEDLKKHNQLDENNLTPWIAHHLYTRSFFIKDRAIDRADQAAFDYFKGQAVKHWASLGSRMARAHVALGLHRLGETEVPKLVTRSLRENAVSNEEMGMWWKDSEGEGWWWWQAPIETQALMIEAFRDIDADAKAVEDCQVWLLKQKQVQDWKTTKATADAVHALLLGGTNLLGSDALIEITLGTLTVKPEKVEAGTGFFEARFPGPEVKPEFGDITVRKSDAGVSWAGVHWQYLEDMAKVTSHNATPLQLEKSLFIRKNTPRGPELEEVKGPVKVGDELVTRLVLKNDRAMEFIHLKDFRGSGTEPVNVLSGYRWQDGFGYYEVTRDTASHFFIDRLPPGTHVFESSARVQHAGTYQTGFAEIRCMYAPEFNAHSRSIPITAEK